MKGALIILLFTIVAGIIIYLVDKKFYRGGKAAGQAKKDVFPPAGEEAAASVEKADEGEEECCGMHAVCEKTSLSPLDTAAEYYDDEELDRFRGFSAEEYSESDVEEFREILMTLLPEDVAGWSRSLQVRGIVLPEEVRDELLMIVRELRDEARS